MIRLIEMFKLLLAVGNIYVNKTAKWFLWSKLWCQQVFWTEFNLIGNKLESSHSIKDLWSWKNFANNSD